VFDREVRPARCPKSIAKTEFGYKALLAETDLRAVTLFYRRRLGEPRRIYEHHRWLRHLQPAVAGTNRTRFNMELASESAREHSFIIDKRRRLAI
jgi:hypothetical protein